jgi:hypothetical protein
VATAHLHFICRPLRSWVRPTQILADVSGLRPWAK